MTTPQRLWSRTITLARSWEERRLARRRFGKALQHAFRRFRYRLVWAFLKLKMSRANRQAFVLWHGQDRRSPLAWLKPGGQQTRDERIFLFPDRLRACFWVGGIFGTIILAFNAFDPEPACSCKAYGTDPLPSLGWAFLSLIACVYLVPYFIYVLCRNSVLEDFERQLPGTFRSWIKVGIGSDGRWATPASPADTAARKADPLLMAFRWMTPALSRRGQLPVAYDGPDSRQGMLTRIAMAEFFNSRHASSKTFALYNWIAYGLAPLWTFLLLMIVVLVAAAFSKGCLVQKEDLLLFDVAWVFLAGIFFVIEMPHMPNDLQVKAEDLASLPSQIARPETGLVTVITNNSFRLMLNAAVTVIAVVYATLAALVG